MAASSRTQANGVLPVSVSQTSGNAQKPVASKPPAPKLKVIIRRLPPGLTEEEFASILGDDWKLGKGKVDWCLYKPGKDSKDPSKPSRPARAYLHLINESLLLPLSEVVRQSIFEDALNTSANPCLVGPPSVEFAPYGRTPGGRRRVDARAGTIDQDPEFMAFLEGLANPVSFKEANSEAFGTESASAKAEKVTTTPLVQYLRDKKANKNKEAAVKAAKKQEAQQAKSKAAASSSEELKRKGRDGKADRSVVKAAKEAVKILNREASSKASSSTSATTKSETARAENTPPSKCVHGKAGERPKGMGMTAHIRMLQRDLGLSPAQAHRQLRRDNADAQRIEKAATTEKAEAAPSLAASQAAPSHVIPTAPKGSLPPSSAARGPRKRGLPIKTEVAAQAALTAGPSTPVLLLKKSDTAQTSSTPTNTTLAKPAPVTNARKAPPIAVPTEGATQAFVKHANPSQGVTEGLLKEALEKFGSVSFVEIDKRKGFAYVDFIDTDGLKKAMAANPIAVAQGTVHVAQRKGVAPVPEKKPSPQIPTAPANRGGRGGHGRGSTIGRRGGRGGRGGAHAEAGRAPSIPTGPSVK